MRSALIKLNGIIFNASFTTGVLHMYIRNLISVAAISGASLLFSTGAFAADPAGVYSFTVCNSSLDIKGMAILDKSGAVTIIDDNEAAADTATVGLWDKNGQNITGKARFFREGVPVPVDIFITNGVYDKATGKINGSLSIPLTGTNCNDLVLTPYTL